MTNLLPNAAFLDLATGWDAGGADRLTVDETTHGDWGRAALMAEFDDVTTDEVVSIAVRPNLRPRVTPGSEIEVSGAFAAFLGSEAHAPAVRIIFRDDAADEVDAVDIRLGPPFDLYGTALMGLRQTYWCAMERLIVPADAATADLEVSFEVEAAGDVTLLMLKPQVCEVPSGRLEPLVWSPGPSENPDLDLEQWPTVLRPLNRDGSSEGRPALVEFLGDAGRPSSRSITADPARSYTFSVWCDPVQRAELERFYRSAPADFWFVEPDSDRLCVAKFASSGAPSLAEHQGHMVRMEGTLWVETA